MDIVFIQMANYTLSFMMWMIVGRGFLALIIGNRQSTMLLAFVKVTEPMYSVTRKILPFARERWVPALSFFLLAAVRLAMVLVLHPAAGR